MSPLVDRADNDNVQSEIESAKASPTSNDHAIATAAKNVLYAFALLRAVSFLSVRGGVPLFGFLAGPIPASLRYIFAVGIFLLWLRRSKWHVPLMWVAALNVVFQFCTSYSNVGAFSFPTFFLFVFGALYLDRPSKDLRPQAIFFISLIFLFSAMQKMNPSYLAGNEFRIGSPFLSFVHGWFPSFAWSTPNTTLPAIAWFSVLVEFAIGVGLLLRPALFSQIVVIFILTLSYVHPPVAYVYFFFLPLLLIAADGFSPAFLRRAAHPGPLPAIALMLIIKVVVFETVESKAIPYLTYVLITLLAIVHVLIFLGRPQTSSLFPRFDSRSRKNYVLPILMTATFVGAFICLPSPLGFSMFAARRFQVPTYFLKIYQGDACSFANAKWRFAGVTDSYFERLQDGTCQIRFPTTSGLQVIVDSICEKLPNTTFELVTGTSSSPIPCDSISKEF